MIARLSRTFAAFATVSGLSLLGLTTGLALGLAAPARADLTASASDAPPPGLAALRRCVGDLGQAAQVTTDYGCAELGASACQPDLSGLSREECLHLTRRGLAEEVGRALDAMPRRVPVTLGMPQDEYRSMRRSLRAAPDWPGCESGPEGALCEYRHVVEQWVEARELRRALDAAEEGTGE